MKLNFETNIAEGTPEELVEYLRLVEEGEKKSGNELFSFAHSHQPDEDTLKSLVGSLVKVADSYTGSTEAESTVYDKGAFYVTTSESSKSFLPVGVILKHQHGRKFEDSTGAQYIISTTSYVKRADSGGDVTRKDRFELAKQLGIQLTSTTDFVVESRNRKFKVKESGTDFNEGDIVAIAKDDGDNLPQCKDKYSNFSYVYLRNLELVKEEVEPTELKVGDKVKVLASLRGAEGEATVTKVLEGGNVLIAGTSKAGTYLPNWSNHVMNLEKIEEETASTEFKVGDKVKVLDSQNGAEGEATITALLEDGKVRLEGKSGSGVYSYCWSNRVSNIEKIEEEDEDLEPEEADELLGYRYWYLEGTNFNNFVVLEASPKGYFEDSRGKRYTYQAVSGYVKPVDREDAYVKFDDAERKGALLRYYPTLNIFQLSY